MAESGRNVLASSVRNASFTIAFQLLFRCVTFAVNAWVLRHVGHAALGIMNVRLLLLESTILFLSRESFLRACLGHRSSSSWPQLINQMWLTVPVGAVFSAVSLYVWLRILPLGHPEYESHYVIGCWSVALSCIIELLSSAVTLVAQIFCFVKLKVVLDTLYVFIRTVVFLAVIVRDPSLILIGFSAAQVIGAIIASVSYYAFFTYYIKKLNTHREDIKLGKPIDPITSKHFKDMEDFPFKSVGELLPRRAAIGGRLLDPQLCELTLSFAKQGFVKQILTEGEKYVMSVSPVLSFSEQAIYDVVNNLGSLAARFVFRPIEDSGYFYFTQTIDRDRPISEQDAEKIKESCNVLSQLCRVVTSIGLVVLVFGQSYSRTLLLMYGGEGFVETGLPVVLMRCHCLAVVLLAVNGVTECYCFATMTGTQLDKYNYVMVLFSVSFLALSYVLTNLLGPVGFILSNCINMSARIVHSLYFIGGKYRGSPHRPLEGLVVGRVFGGGLMIAGLVCKISEIRISNYSQMLHIAIGSVAFAAVLSAWVYENWKLAELVFVKFVKKKRDHGKDKDE